MQNQMGFQLEGHAWAFKCGMLGPDVQGQGGDRPGLPQSGHCTIVVLVGQEQHMAGCDGPKLFEVWHRWGVRYETVVSVHVAMWLGGTGSSVPGTSSLSRGGTYLGGIGFVVAAVEHGWLEQTML